MHIALPIAFLLIQGAILMLAPAVATPACYILLVVAPLLVSAATFLRGRRETGSARIGWWALGLSLFIWSIGAFDNLWQEMVKGHADEMYPIAMLGFMLAEVPVTFILATEWRMSEERRMVRAMDALIALMLGYAYFLYTWSLMTARGAPDEAGVAAMIWMLDAQNLIIAITAFVRWRAADDAREQSLFRALFFYGVAYLVLLFYNNHFIAGDPSTSVQDSSIITLAFVLLAGMALRRPVAGAVIARRPDPRLVRAVRGASPLLLAAALLVLSLFLIRFNYVLGAAGILVAVLGYGMRVLMTQVKHIEREDQLEQTTSALQSIAWTDALTGVANRRALDQALGGAARRVGQPLSVLMIDIDHFKLLNDRYGHPAGDSCLRHVARALQQGLSRPTDVLARYGGEEFIVLLQEGSEAGAGAVAERLRAAIANLRIEHEDSSFGIVTVSIGVASALVHGPGDSELLVKQADEALYRAKCFGRNRVEGSSGGGASTVDVPGSDAGRAPRQASARANLRLVESSERKAQAD